MDRAAGIAARNGVVLEARTVPVSGLIRRAWVREACRKCSYFGRSWSCPPGVRGMPQTGRVTRTFRRVLLVRFRESGEREGLEKAVLDIEAALRKAGFPRALGFFVSPCTACSECRYPEDCTHPDKCRATGEAWGIDLIGTFRKAGMPIEVVRNGELFRPVTVFLLD